MSLLSEELIRRASFLKDDWAKGKSVVLHWAIITGVALILILGMLVCLELGYRAGRRQIAMGPEAARIGTEPVVAAVFGLMGLIIAFSFAGAIGRLDQRRQEIIDEANAIGTAYLRLDLLPDNERAELRRLFRDYLDARIAMHTKLPDIKAARIEQTRSFELQDEIWKRSVAAAQTDGRTSTTMLLLSALNTMIDVTDAETIIITTHAPPPLLGLLVVLGFLSSVMAGYALSHNEHRPWLHMLGFGFMIALTIFVIIDLEFPRAGFIRVNRADRVMYDLRETMNK
jgi:hypothetical protein